MQQSRFQNGSPKWLMANINGVTKWQQMEWSDGKWRLLHHYRQVSIASSIYVIYVPVYIYIYIHIYYILQLALHISLIADHDMHMAVAHGHVFIWHTVCHCITSFLTCNHFDTDWLYKSCMIIIILSCIIQKIYITLYYKIIHMIILMQLHIYIYTYNTLWVTVLYYNYYAYQYVCNSL